MSATTGPLLPAPVFGTLRFADGRQVKDTAPWAIVMTPPPQAAHVRREEQLALLLELSGPLASRMQRELREVFARTYWSAAGSITAALRQAAAAANQHLFQANLRAVPVERHEGGLVCAVLRGEDAFILRAGHACAWFFQHGPGYLKCISGSEALPPLGSASPLEVRLHHTFIAPGDKMLMASFHLSEVVDEDGLSRVLGLPGREDVLAGLEQIGGSAGDFCALLIHWPLPEAQPAAPEARPPAERRERLAILPRLRLSEPPEPPMAAEADELRVHTAPAVELPAEDEYAPHPDLSEWAARVGNGVIAAGNTLVKGLRALFRNMLPAPGRVARARTRPMTAPRPARQAPAENRVAMMLAAILIPVVLSVIVIAAYLAFGETARLQSLIHQAEREIALAQAVGGSTENARPHWEAALSYAGEALALRPDHPMASALRKQAQNALDLLDNIVRLAPVLLKDFGSAGTYRIAVHGQSVFIMNSTDGWVSRLTLTSSGDGVLEQDAIPVFVRTGQAIGEGRVGKLVDLVWVDLAGGRRSSGLVILEEDGALVCYDPAWEDESGQPRLSRIYLGTPPVSPLAVDTYEGRLYILDIGANQIRRYEPAGDTYPERPEHYFVTSPPRSLTEARDMAIDGFVYVLYNDGEIRKFLRGDSQPFEARGIPNGLNQPVALAVDPHGSTGVVYVADRGNRRVVALGPDGAFWTQFYAEGEAFEALEALAVDESARLLYVVSSGRAYAARLPLP
ncbi:MAG: hypothetical protein N2508_11605 [Anaerolineae bacterium]|nr:hypothetical protein [Anaerolineae bacterium]